MLWSEYFYSDHTQYRIRHCIACRNHEPGVTCLRHDPLNKGKCPVADGAPQLMEENDVAIELFNELVQSAQRFDGEKKVLLFIRPTDAEACFRLHGVPESELELMQTKIMVLQNMTNKVRVERKRS